MAAGAGPGRSALVVAAVACGQLSIGWSNDWLDAVRGLDDDRQDKAVGTGRATVGAVRTAALVALAACVVLSALLGPLAAAVHLVAVAGGWAYNARLKTTALSPLPYLVSFGLLPSVVTAAAGAGAAPVWATATGACFGVGGHFANVLPDLAVDAAAGVRGLPHRVGRAGTLAGTVGALGVGAATVLVVPGDAAVDPLTAGVAAVVAGLLVAVLGLGAARRDEAAYRAAMATGLLIVALLVVRGDALVGAA